MKKQFGFILLLVAISVSSLVYASPEAHEAAGHHPAITLDFIFRIVNFVIFGGVMFFLLRKPAADFFASRSTTLKVAISEAKAAHAKALSDNREIKARLAKIEEETAALTRSFKDQGALEQEKIISQANEYAQRIREDAKKIAESEFRKAKEQLKETTVLLAHELAEKMIQNELNEDDEDRLADSTIRRLKSLH